MSTEHFDPEIERAYRQPQSFVDSPLFEAEIAARLYRRVRMRRRVVGVVSVVGAFMALRHLVAVRVERGFEAGSVLSLLERRGNSSIVEPALETARQMGFVEFSFGSVNEAQILLIGGAAISLILLALAIRLANSL